MHIEIHGNVGQVIVVEAGASPTIHIDGGQARVYGAGGGSSTDRCPTRTTAAQRTTWGARCVGASAPEGWSPETFSSEKAFVDSKVPEGLAKGDAIFFWKKDCDRDSAPEGFELVHLSENGTGIIVPVASTTLAGGDDDDDLISEISSLPLEDDEGDEGDDSPPPPPPPAANPSPFEED